MDHQVQLSYIGLVRNVIGYSEENLLVHNGTTVGELLGLLIDKHGPSFRASVLRQNGELRSTAQVCVDDRDISDLQGFDTKLDGERLGVLGDIYKMFNVKWGLKDPYRLDPNQRYTMDELYDRWSKSLFGAAFGIDWFKTHGYHGPLPLNMDRVDPISSGVDSCVRVKVSRAAQRA